MEVTKEKSNRLSSFTYRQISYLLFLKSVEMIFQVKECLKGCIRGLFMAVNGLCIFVAIFTIGFAVMDATEILTRYKGPTFGSMIGDFFLIVTFLSLVVISCFGCIGAVRQDVKLLYAYMGLTAILMVTQFMLGIFVSLQRYSLEFGISDWMREEFYTNYTGIEINDHRRFWGDLESSYKCCGLDGPEDYINMGKEVEVSCCERAYNTRNELAQQLLYKTCLSSKEYYKDGCEDEVLFTLRVGSAFLFWIFILCYFLESNAILMSLWAANNIKNEIQLYKEALRY